MDRQHIQSHGLKQIVYIYANGVLISRGLNTRNPDYPSYLDLFESPVVFLS